MGYDSAEQLAKHNRQVYAYLKLHKKLGTGVQGTAYLTKKKTVVKVSCDCDESKIVGWLMQIKAKHPAEAIHLPEIYRAHKVYDKYYRAFDEEYLHVVEREPLRDLPDSILNDETFQDAMMEYMRNQHELRMRELGYQSMDREEPFFAKYYEKPTKPYRPFVEAYKKTIKLLLDNNVFPGDSAPYNWGKRKDGTLVLRDFGLFTRIEPCAKST